MLGTSVQVFRGGQLGVWVQEVGRELDLDLVNPEKVVKINDKEIFYMLSYYSEDERYNYYCLNLLSYYSEDKEIFYLL